LKRGWEFVAPPNFFSTERITTSASTIDHTENRCREGVEEACDARRKRVRERKLKSQRNQSLARNHLHVIVDAVITNDQYERTCCVRGREEGVWIVVGPLWGGGIGRLEAVRPHLPEKRSAADDQLSLVVDKKGEEKRGKD